MNYWIPIAVGLGTLGFLWALSALINWILSGPAHTPSLNPPISRADLEANAQLARRRHDRLTQRTLV